MEAKKVNSIMDKLEESDGNGHHRENNIDHLAPLYESDNEEGTQHRTKPKNPSIVLS